MSHASRPRVPISDESAKSKYIINTEIKRKRERERERGGEKTEQLQFSSEREILDLRLDFSLATRSNVRSEDRVIAWDES